LSREKKNKKHTVYNLQPATREPVIRFIVGSVYCKLAPTKKPIHKRQS